MENYPDVTQAIGKTPLVKLNRITKGLHAEIYAKLESFNPFGSVKDRVALAMIDDAHKRGILKSDSVIIEPTSGNTGIALAGIAAVKGYRLIVTIPGSMPAERYKILRALGADVIVTPGWQGMSGAIRKAERLASTTPNSVLLHQFKNPINPEIHRKTTAQEIWQDMSGNVDILVTGVGTGGTFTGLAQALKVHNPAIKAIAVVLDDFPLSSPNPHWWQRILRTGLEPAAEVFDQRLVDEYIHVHDTDIKKTARQLAAQEGIMGGFSCGAAMWAALHLAQRTENAGKKIVVILPDGGDRYLSTKLFGLT